MTPTSTSPSGKTELTREGRKPLRIKGIRRPQIARRNTKAERKAHAKRTRELLKLKRKLGPEGYKAYVAEQRRLHPEKYTRAGVPDGMRKHKADKLWAAARTKATELMKMIDETFDPAVVAVDVPDTDAGKAAKVLHEMCTIALGPSGIRDKISAANAVLAYTKEKPVTKTESKISTAEDWLKAAVEAAK